MLLSSSLCVSVQLYFVYWDMSRCLRALTETLEERSFVANDTQVSESSTSVALFVLLLYRFFLCSHVSPPFKVNRNIILAATERIFISGLANSTFHGFPRSRVEGVKMIRNMSHFHQKKLKRKLSHLVLVSEVTAVDPEESDVEQGSDEQRPLLRNEETGCSTSTSQQEGAKVTTSYSLIPDASLPAQVQRLDAARLLCYVISLSRYIF